MWRKLIGCGFGLVLGAALAGAAPIGRTGTIKSPSLPTQPTKPTYVRDAVLVALRPERRESTLQLVQAYGLQLEPSSSSVHFSRLRIPTPLVRAGFDALWMSDLLAQDPAIRIAEPDFIYHIAQVPNDTLFGDLYGLNNTGQSGGRVDADIDGLEAWSEATGQGRIIAVVDTGIELAHPDLSSNLLRNAQNQVIGYDFINNDSVPGDDNGHGSHISGIIGAVGNNNRGVIGLAYRAKIMPIKSFDATGGGPNSAQISGIDFAIANGADVINASWGGVARSELLLEAIGRARAAGIFVSAAAGNNASNNDVTPYYPANFGAEIDNLISVANSTRWDQLSTQSNFGTKVLIAAPGDAIMSTVPTGRYENRNGTSQATAYVSAAAALVLERDPNLSPAAVRTRLMNTADNVFALQGRISNGRLNAYRAAQNDLVAPSMPTGATVLGRSASTIRLRWIHDSGDDGSAGQALSYLISAAPFALDGDNLAQAPRRTETTPDQPFGAEQIGHVDGLFPGESYWVAIQAKDDVGNISLPQFFGPFSTVAPLWADRAETLGAMQPSTGSGWALTTADKAAGQSAWTDSPTGNYPNSSDSWLTVADSITVDRPMVFRFAARLALERGFDFLHVELSDNGGASWSRPMSLTGVEPWQVYELSLLDFVGKTVRLRFRLVTDVNLSMDGVYLDDLNLIALSRVFSDDMEGGTEFQPAAGSPWGLVTSQRFSPVNSWSDSPSGNYSDSIDARLVSKAPLSLESIANARLRYRALFDLEAGFDYFRTYIRRNGIGLYYQCSQHTGKQATWAAFEAPLGLARTGELMFRVQSDSNTVFDGVYLDDVEVLGEPFEPIEPTLPVVMHLSLGGFEGDLQGRTLTVQVRESGGQVLEEYTVQPAWGAKPGEAVAEISTSVEGLAEITIQGGAWLKRVLPRLRLGQSELHVSASLINGDIDGSNAIDLDDYFALADSYRLSKGQAGFNALADLNGDDTVNLDDYFILAEGYRKVGDE